jgi:hypothetical protein
MAGLEDDEEENINNDEWPDQMDDEEWPDAYEEDKMGMSDKNPS